MQKKRRGLIKPKLNASKLLFRLITDNLEGVCEAIKTKLVNSASAALAAVDGCQVSNLHRRTDPNVVYTPAVEQHKL